MQPSAESSLRVRQRFSALWNSPHRKRFEIPSCLAQRLRAGHLQLAIATNSIHFPLTPISKVGDSYYLPSIGVPYNLLGYRLTTKAGLTYHFTQQEGLQDITDRNGNTLTFTPDAITSSTDASLPESLSA